MAHNSPQVIVGLNLTNAYFELEEIWNKQGNNLELV